MTTATPGALGGVRVVDLTRVLAGPLCTQMLADHGADVVKVEPPAGDETRRLGPPYDKLGHAAYFSALNRGKQAISLDLSHPDAQAVLHRLLADADVLVENFLPGTMERWGLGYDTALRQRYPRLVYCAISGFGSDGPLGGLPGYDAVLQAMCGLMSINGDGAMGTVKVGMPIVDHLTGYVALSGILLALQARVRSGRGQRVEATLYDTALSLLLPHAANWFASQKVPGLLGSAHPNIAPYDKFQTPSGELFIGILNDGQFRRFCRLVGLEELPEDPRFADNAHRVAHREVLKERIQTAIATWDCGALCEALMRAGVPAGSVNAVPQALAHPHTAHRQLVLREGAYVGLRAPMRLGDSGSVSHRLPPAFAQDTQAVLGGLGYSAADVLRMHTSGAVHLP